MPIDTIERAFVVEGLPVLVRVWRWTCDNCGNHEAFYDLPMPEGHTETDAQKRGWVVLFAHGFDGEGCSCPTCVALDRARGKG
jgi:hypothetical protein